LESAIDQNEGRVKPGNELGQPTECWEAVRSRVQNYLRAGQSGSADPVLDLLPLVYEAAQERVSANPRLDMFEVAIEECDRLLKEHLARLLEQSSNQNQTKDLTHLRTGVLWAHLNAPVSDKLSPGDRAIAEYVDAELRQYHVPQRPMETSPKRMRSSLTRIPSFRLVGGWCLVILVLILTFLFTHRVP
jgi:hypothetical protein